MNDALARLVADYQDRVRIAVDLMKQSGIPLPASNMAWATNGLPHHGHLHGGVTYFKHGFGCRVDLPDGEVDFDFGDHGEVDGFDAWRLSGFAGSRLADRGFPSTKALDEQLRKEAATGSLVFDGHHLYYVARAARSPNRAPSAREATAWAPPPGSPSALAIAHVAARSDGPPIDPSLRVTLNFHPDRLHRGVPLLAAMASDGVYRSQFETGSSNGGLTAHPGGERWAWESRLFGAAYDDAPAAERPKYGALNHRRRATGGSPRFGSAHLRLRPEVLARSTFCYPDSVFGPEHVGTASRMALAALADADARDALDDYIEAHVHGPLRLDRDVEALVLDPCFRGTDVEAQARAWPCPVEWHPGFRLPVEVLRRHPDYRGPAYVALGEALARDGLLTPAMLGDAARTGRHDPQDLKKVWHCIARFGAPEPDQALQAGPSIDPDTR